MKIALWKWGIGLAFVAGLLWWQHDASAALKTPLTPKPVPPPGPIPPLAAPQGPLPDPPRSTAGSSPGNQPPSWTEIVLTSAVPATPLDATGSDAGPAVIMPIGKHLFVFTANADPTGAVVMDYSGLSYRILHVDLRTVGAAPAFGTTKFPIRQLVFI